MDWPLSNDQNSHKRFALFNWSSLQNKTKENDVIHMQYFDNSVRNDWNNLATSKMSHNYQETIGWKNRISITHNDKKLS